MRRRTVLLLLVATALVGTLATLGSGSGTEPAGPTARAAATGAGHRYVAISPGSTHRYTIVMRIERREDRISGRWRLRGHFVLPPLSFNGSVSGVSPDGATVVLSRASTFYPPRPTELAILDTRSRSRRGSVMRVKLARSYTVQTISPHGTTIYLERHPVSWVEGQFQVVAMRTGGRRGASPPLETARLEPDGQMAGAMLDQVRSPDGRWAYTLYGGKRVEPFVLALDTVRGRAKRVDLPRLRFAHDYERFDLALRTSGDGRSVYLLNRRPSLPGSRPLLRIDAKRLAVEEPIGEWEETVGRSAEGRPIRLRQLGDPGLRKSVLVFGCIHGDECGARGLSPTVYGCPDTYSNVYVVPNLNPDGAALDTRLNARGVDLNRNFSAEWSGGGKPGDPEYAGPSPASEPETRLAARLVRHLRPRVTIWFHQHRAERPLVRAWGGSVPSARRFARLAALPFRSLPWPRGTAPNWQNHAFPDASSFVDELPRSRIGDERKRRLEWAIVHLARWVSHDGHVVRTR